MCFLYCFYLFNGWQLKFSAQYPVRDVVPNIFAALLKKLRLDSGHSVPYTYKIRADELRKSFDPLQETEQRRPY
jgi:hypothetical protein